MSRLQAQYAPSSLTLWGRDPAELSKYTKLMQDRSRGDGGPNDWSGSIELLDRRWFVTDLEWETNEGVPLYKITLRAVVEI
jgi:hypothetical protein